MNWDRGHGTSGGHLRAARQDRLEYALRVTASGVRTEHGQHAQPDLPGHDRCCQNVMTRRRSDRNDPPGGAIDDRAQQVLELADLVAPVQGVEISVVLHPELAGAIAEWVETVQRTRPADQEEAVPGCHEREG